MAEGRDQIPSSARQSTGEHAGESTSTGPLDELKQALAGTDVEVSAICAGYDGYLLAPEKSTRRGAVSSMKEILTAAGELGSTGLIVVPAFTSQKQLPPQEGSKVLKGLLAELGEHARECGTTVMLEPVNRTITTFLRRVAHAASICRDVDEPGVGLLADFFHMYFEETSDLGAVLSAGRWCRHVHLSGGQQHVQGVSARKLPGQGRRSFVQGFQGLKLIGYRGYCSFECGSGDNPEKETPGSVRFIRREWKKARVGNVGAHLDLRSE